MFHIEVETFIYGTMPRTNKHKRIAEHFTYFLASEGYLKNGYSINKKQMKAVFMHEYLVNHPIHVKPYEILQFLVFAKCVKKQRKKNENTETLSEENVVFVAEKVQEILLNFGRNPVETPLDNFSEKPVIKVYITQQHAFDMKYKKNPASTEKECKLCHLSFSNRTEFEEHIKKESHTVREHYRNDRKLLGTNKYVIIYVESKKIIGYEEIIARENVGGSISLTICNKGKIAYQILEIFTLCEVDEIVEKFPVFPLLLNPGENISMPMDFEFPTGGAYIYPIVLKLYSTSDGFSYVLKELIFRVQHEFLDDLKPTSPYVKPLKQIQKVEETPIVYGEPPPLVPSGLVNEQKLAQYVLPSSLRRIINHGLKKFLNMTPQDREKLNEVRSLLDLYTGIEVSQLLKEDNYSKLLSLLLYIEEHQMEIDIHMYDRDDVKMQEEVVFGKKLLSLKVPGLAENRPSVLRGDKVYVKIQGDNSLKYEGNVHYVREAEVLLGFNKKLSEKYSIPASKFHVEYSVNRLPMRVQHRALEMIRDSRLSYILFPKQHSRKEIFKLSWYSKKVSQNPQQQQAVMNIVAGTAFPSPYLVFGPPGTGKTVTVVEAITQLYHMKKPKGHLLVSAPSNSAADEIAKRLIINDTCTNGYIPESSVLRLYAASRNPSAIPEELKKCSNFKDGFYYPAKADIMKYNIVIVTLTTAGRLVSGGIPTGHFSHLFIDECGQAVEPETLIPLAGLFASQEQKGKLFGHWILVGDPKQLGPILRSPVAKKLRLDISLLERLMVTCDLYQKNKETNQYNPNVLTKLVQNFRSHKHILALPNKLFYDNELQVCADPALTTLACKWDSLPKEGFPLIFHGVKGKDQREGNSPSYFNVPEIEVILMYVGRILVDRFSGRKLQQADIGIITPYRKQVEKIRKAFKKKKWDNISVGSVEEFQGQERPVIIISTVRSTMELVNEDYKFHLGFLRNPKRFNVAMTRSKALLIIVGDPNVLQCDFNWRELIIFCKQNGSYTGCPFKLMDVAPQEQESLIFNFSALQIDPTENKKEDGPQWRGDI